MVNIYKCGKFSSKYVTVFDEGLIEAMKNEGW